MKRQPKNPGAVWIKLTDEQQQQLQQHFDLVNWNAEHGERGMLVAQVWESRVECSGAGMCVGFLDAHVADKFQGAVKTKLKLRSLEIEITGESTDAEASPVVRIPHPDFCVHPKKCQGRNQCPRRPVCCE